jgi:hypothetical protein
VSFDQAKGDDVLGPLWKDVACECGSKRWYLVRFCSMREARINKKGEKRIAEIITEVRMCQRCDKEFKNPLEENGDGAKTEIFPAN